MSKVILVVGLPASGKTTFALNFCKEVSGILVDDPKDFVEVLTALKSSQTVVVTDPLLCIPSTRDKAQKRLESLGVEIDWVFFENNPVQCQVNASKRDGKPVQNEILYFSKKYIIPDNATILKVYTPT